MSALPILSAWPALAARASEIEAGPEPDWVTLGLVLCLVGAFLLGNAILFRHPRDLVRERFAASYAAPSSARVAPLLGIREQIFHRLQVATGFFYLVAGFAVELVGHFRPLAAGRTPHFPVFWIALVVLVTGLSWILGWWSSSRSFRRHVRAHLAKHPPEFEADLAFAREVGDLFGVERHKDDTVETYVARLRHELKLAPPRAARRDVNLPFEREDELES